jgi:hypothetical protein
MRRKGWVALLALGMALTMPLLLHARNNSKHPETPKDVQKSSKAYNKQLRKDQKHQAKIAKKEAKANKKRRTTTVTHSVTG